MPSGGEGENARDSVPFRKKATRSKMSSNSKRRGVQAQAEKRSNEESPLKKLRLARATQDAAEPSDAIVFSKVEGILGNLMILLTSASFSNSNEPLKCATTRIGNCPAGNDCAVWEL